MYIVSSLAYVFQTQGMANYKKQGPVANYKKQGPVSTTPVHTMNMKDFSQYLKEGLV